MSQESPQCLLSESSRQPIRVASARGSWLTDHTGRDYLDFVQGNAANTLGHAPETIQISLKEQARRLLYCSPNLHHEPMLQLAQRLTGLAGLERIAFSASASEANENAIRLARRWGAAHNANKIISTRPDLPGQTHFVKVPFNDLAAVENVIDRQTVAIWVEPIDSSLSQPSPFYLRGLRRLTHDHGILLIVDESRCGPGRSGKLFAYQHDEIVPDILTLAQGLAGGLPLAATLVKREFASVLESHGPTGNSLSMSAALAQLDTLCQTGFLAEVQAAGQYLQQGLQRLARHHRQGVVRGCGLWQALQIPDSTAREVAQRALAQGLIIDAPQADWLRLQPALNVSLAEIDEMLVRLACTLS